MIIKYKCRRQGQYLFGLRLSATCHVSKLHNQFIKDFINIFSQKIILTSDNVLKKFLQKIQKKSEL